MNEVKGKATTRAKNKYRDKTYDRMELVLPKGRKEQLKEYVQTSGESLNAFVNRAIDEAMQRDTQSSTTTTTQAVLTKKESPPQKEKLTPSILLAEDGKRGTSTSTGKDTPIEECDLLPEQED